MRAQKQRSAMELSSEVANLKQQRNKDQDDVRLLKVEMQKLDQAFKKYRQIVPKGHNNVKVELPDFVKMAQTDGVSTEEIILEVSKVKNLLQIETQNFIRQHQQE